MQRARPSVVPNMRYKLPPVHSAIVVDTSKGDARLHPGQIDLRVEVQKADDGSYVYGSVDIYRNNHKVCSAIWDGATGLQARVCQGQEIARDAARAVYNLFVGSDDPAISGYRLATYGGRIITRRDLINGKSSDPVSSALEPPKRNKWRKVTKAQAALAEKMKGLDGASAGAGTDVTQYFLFGRGTRELPAWINRAGLVTAEILDPATDLPESFTTPRGIVCSSIEQALYSARQYEPRFFADGNAYRIPPDGDPDTLARRSAAEMAGHGFKEDLWKQHRDQYLKEIVYAACAANPNTMGAILRQVKTQIAHGTVEMVYLVFQNPWLGRMSRAGRPPRQGTKPRGGGANQLGKTYLSFAAQLE